MVAKTKVVLIRCNTYEDDRVLNSLASGLDLLGGIASFVKPGEKIVLKPNVLIGTNPDKGVTTHPAVFTAMAKLLKDAGARVYYGDSPSFGKAKFNLSRSGLKTAGDRLGLTLSDFDTGRTVSHKHALLVKKFVIAHGALDCDGLVSLPRFKTHGFLRFTGAIKNQFGCIPGLRKSQYHVKLADPFDFATMLVDLNMIIRPRLYIMDGIKAMEGNGPRSGKLKNLNVLLLSSDPVALDAIACRIMQLDPAIVPTAQAGERAGLGTYHAENIEIIGDDLDSFIDASFEVKRTPLATRSSGLFRTLLKNIITERPVIDKTKCTLCGTCIEMCSVAPKAVDWDNGDQSQPPRYNYNRCIRCYCCQETCPEGAISIYQPLPGRVMSRL